MTSAGEIEMESTGVLLYESSASWGSYPEYLVLQETFADTDY